MEEFNFFEQKVIASFREHKPYLLDIETLISEMKFGKLNIVLTVADGKVLNMEILGRQLVRYDKGEVLTKNN